MTKHETETKYNRHEKTWWAVCACGWLAGPHADGDQSERSAEAHFRENKG